MASVPVSVAYVTDKEFFPLYLETLEEQVKSSNIPNNRIMLLLLELRNSTKRNFYFFYFMYSAQSVRRMSPLRRKVSCMAKAAERQWWVCPPVLAAYFR